MFIEVRELDIFKLTDDPAFEYPFEETWVITPTTDREIHPDHRHQRLEVWAPDPENSGEGICIARLSDGLRPCYGKLLLLALQGMWGGIAHLAAKIVAGARRGRESNFKSGTWRDDVREAVDQLGGSRPGPVGLCDEVAAFEVARQIVLEVDLNGNDAIPEDIVKAARWALRLDEDDVQGDIAPPAPVLFQGARFVWCRACQWVGLAWELIPEHWNEDDDHGLCPVCQGGGELRPIPHAGGALTAWRMANENHLADQLRAAVIRANGPEGRPAAERPAGDRGEEVYRIPAAEALDLGSSGPCLRELLRDIAFRSSNLPQREREVEEAGGDFWSDRYLDVQIRGPHFVVSLVEAAGVEVGL